MPFSLIPSHSTQEDTFTLGTSILIVYSPSKSAQLVTSALSTTVTAQVRDFWIRATLEHKRKAHTRPLDTYQGAADLAEAPVKGVL